MKLVPVNPPHPPTPPPHSLRGLPATSRFGFATCSIGKFVKLPNNDVVLFCFLFVFCFVLVKRRKVIFQ